MRSYDMRPDFYNMWCLSPSPYDEPNPETNNYNNLAQEWRCGGQSIKEAKENFFAHITGNRRVRRNIRIEHQ